MSSGNLSPETLAAEAVNAVKFLEKVAFMATTMQNYAPVIANEHAALLKIERLAREARGKIKEIFIAMKELHPR